MHMNCFLIIKKSMPSLTIALGLGRNGQKICKNLYNEPLISQILG